MSGKTKPSLFIKVLVTFMLSIIAAIGMAVMLDGILGGSRLFGIHIVGNTRSNLIVGVFALTFIICATGIILKSPNASKIKKSKQGRKIVSKNNIWQSRKSLTKEVPKKKKKNESREELLNAIKKSTESKPDDLNLKKKEPKSTSFESQNELNTDVQKTDKPYTQEKILSKNILNFLNNSLEGKFASKAKLDNFNKFGLSLYIAGAFEVLSKEQESDNNDNSNVLAETVQIIGFKRSHAASFSEKYEEYLVADTRYMQMFQAGRNAMNISTSEKNSESKLFDSAMGEWNKPKVKQSQTGPITVLFTDIVGSTALTQSLGDEDAQKLIRAHNRVVREALSIHAGKEVKHTGDGIMASFSKTSNAVDGAIQIQLETMKHNQVEPNFPLHLKIGLNTGEPIAEDDDLFGTVVQLSARIVDKAIADKIYVSEIVRGICSGKDYKFKDLGEFNMKGFDEEINLFEVLWQ